MSFDREKIKTSYSTDKDNVLKDFYIPVIGKANSYDRAVGYFSTSGLLTFLRGVGGLVENNGKMRLVIGDSLTGDEYAALKNSNNRDEVFLKLDKKWDEILNKDKSELTKYRLDVFSWLCNRGFLEVKYAFRRKGLFHKKIGIIRSNDGETIVFAGSNNETESALISNGNNPDGNSEEFDVYTSWKKESFNDHGKSKIESFDRVWNNKEINTLTIDLPSEHYEKIRNIYTSESAPESSIEARQADLYDQIIEIPDDESFDFIQPKIPATINGYRYQIRDHQVDALKKWQENDYHGIMALATGAGKTITSIHGAVKISENNRVVLVISAPYQVLADQWCDVLETFNIKAIRCYNSRNTWESRLITEIGNFALKISDFFAVVVVNATLATNNFLDSISQVPVNNLFFIGDECHHHGGEGITERLPNAKYKIGLSATPWSRSEVESRERLEKYYGPIVASYTMKDALNDDILTGYKYFIYPVVMNVEEGEVYEELTRKMSSLLNKTHRTAVESQMLSNITFKRSRLLDSLEDKFATLDAILKNTKVSKYTLFYCGSGSSVFSEDQDQNQDGGQTKSIDKVTKLLYDHHWNISKFTAEESHKSRVGILNNFKSGNIDAIAAIRVLDEGFDVPMCREAFITASSRNERQFIQRRGRILRKFPGKDEAIIHDFVIVPSSLDNAYKSLVISELTRVREFYSVANNKSDIYNKVAKIVRDYDLEFDLNEEVENG